MDRTNLLAKGEDPEAHLREEGAVRIRRNILSPWKRVHARIENPFFQCEACLTITRGSWAHVTPTLFLQLHYPHHTRRHNRGLRDERYFLLLGPAHVSPCIVASSKRDRP